MIIEINIKTLEGERIAKVETKSFETAYQQLGNIERHIDSIKATKI